MDNIYQKFFSPASGENEFNSYFIPKKTFDKVNVGLTKGSLEVKIFHIVSEKK